MLNSNKINSFDKSREQLANERTLLAWVRTGLALMGFGFVIAKFTLFLKQLSFMMKIESFTTNPYSDFIGILMLALGILVVILAFIQYKRHERQLLLQTFYTSSSLSLAITLAIVLVGVVLILYLMSVV
jgi:putative membrane protein